MELGLIKSKVEDVLLESYNNGTFKKDMFLFKKLVLEDTSLSKIFFLYDELSSNKGFDSESAEVFLNESVRTFEGLNKKVSKSKVKELEMWLGHINTTNRYQDIDNLFSKKVTMLENKIKSKKSILESICKKENNRIEIKTSLKTMVDVANKTVGDHLSSLDESTKKEIIKVLKEEDSKLEIKFDTLKESVLSRLTKLKQDETDEKTIGTILETMSRVENEKYSKNSYIKLKDLNDNI
jgi:hypothetical protein